jgi:tRNA pseudouridine13 synthase
MRLYPLAHTNDFVFSPSPRDFTVEEIPLYPFAGEGEHVVVQVRKKGLTTWEMIGIFSDHLGIAQREIGYAGLKDKHAMTIQYLSFPARYEAQLEHFAHEGIKILSRTRHTNKLRIGHLKGNRFWLRFKKVLGVERNKIDSVLDWIEAHGMPNYFGAQRFGNDGENWRIGQAIVEGKHRERNRRTRTFLVSAYQSKLFNDWLSHRIEISRLLEAFEPSQVEQVAGLESGTLEGTKLQEPFFKILAGDVMMHYPHGRIFHAEHTVDEAAKFAARDRAPTGLIPGRRTKRSVGYAARIEAAYDAPVAENGSRRYAWVWPEEITRNYRPETAHYELGFVLPKGAYATVLVEMLRGGEVRA